MCVYVCAFVSVCCRICGDKSPELDESGRSLTRMLISDCRPPAGRVSSGPSDSSSLIMATVLLTRRLFQSLGFLYSHRLLSSSATQARAAAAFSTFSFSFSAAASSSAICFSAPAATSAASWSRRDACILALMRLAQFRSTGSNPLDPAPWLPALVLASAACPRPHSTTLLLPGCRSGPAAGVSVCRCRCRTRAWTRTSDIGCRCCSRHAGS